jgi:hypothetical protein
MEMPVGTRDEQPQAAALLTLLEKRSYKTYCCRLRASRRLASRQRAWNASLIGASTATTIASVALLTDDSIYGSAGPTLLVCVSVLTLVASLVGSSLDYSGRARDMFTNYRRIQRLSAEVERVLGSPAPVAAQTVELLNEKYDSLLDESENHTEADYYHAFPDEVKRSAAVWGEDLLSLAPYISLLAPLGLLVPLANWIASGGG